jgi:hypothetical protein
MLTIIRKLSHMPSRAMKHEDAKIQISRMLQAFPSEDNGTSNELHEDQKKRKATYAARAQEKVARQRIQAREKLDANLVAHADDLKGLVCVEAVFVEARSRNVARWVKCNKRAVYLDDWDEMPYCKQHAEWRVSGRIEIKNDELLTLLPPPREIKEQFQCLCWCTEARKRGSEEPRKHYRCKRSAKAFGMCLAHAHKPTGVYLARARALIVHEIRPTGIAGVDRMIAAYFQEGANVFSKVKL